MEEKFDYYICTGNNWSSGCVFFGCNEKRGFIINSNGTVCKCYDGEFISPQWNGRWNRGLSNEAKKLSNLKDCLKLISKEKHSQLFKTLGIKPPDYEPIELTEHTKNLVIEMLTNARAFNGDSAHQFRFDHFEEGVLDAMVELNLIKEINGKYFLDKDD